MNALRAMTYYGVSFSIDWNALRAMTYYDVSFSIDLNAIRAMTYYDVSFSIDMDALRAIAGISHRETISIELIRWMYCFVRRTLTTKSERKFYIMTSNFYHNFSPFCIFNINRL